MPIRVLFSTAFGVLLLLAAFYCAEELKSEDEAQRALFEQNQ
jgi:hypothetical protein